MNKDKKKRREQTTFLLVLALSSWVTSQWLAFFKVSSVLHAPFILRPLLLGFSWLCSPESSQLSPLLSQQPFFSLPFPWLPLCTWHQAGPLSQAVFSLSLSAPFMTFTLPGFCPVFLTAPATQLLCRWPLMLLMPRTLRASCSSNPPFQGAPGLFNIMPHHPFPPTCDLDFSSFHKPPWEVPSHLPIGLISGHPSASGWASLTFAQPRPPCKNFLHYNTQPVFFQWLVKCLFSLQSGHSVLVPSVLCRGSEQKKWGGRETSSALCDPRSGAALPGGHAFIWCAQRELLG